MFWANVGKISLVILNNSSVITRQDAPLHTGSRKAFSSCGQYRKAELPCNADNDGFCSLS